MIAPSFTVQYIFSAGGADAPPKAFALCRVPVRQVKPCFATKQRNYLAYVGSVVHEHTVALSYLGAVR